MFRIIFLILIALPTISIAENKQIITSIRPLQSIIANIVGDSKEVSLIVDKNESLHNYQLKPNKIIELSKSDTIIIIDRNFELFLNKVLDNLGTNHKVIEVAKLPFVELLKNSDHHHGEHEHESEYDYHVWLDPNIVKIIAENLTEIFSKEMPENEKIYRENLSNFILKLNTLDAKVKDQLVSSRNKNFIVTHNAYDYFIKRYQLNEPETISIDHDHNIGAGDLIKIQEKIKEGKIQCIFEEPQFDSNIIAKIKEVSTVKIGKLDPEWGPDNISIKDVYFKIIESLANNFSNCLN